MQFNSYQFVLFLPLVVIIYYIIPPKLRNAFLLFASYYFYMNWEPVYACLILFITAVSYFTAIALNRFDRRRVKERKAILAAGCIVSVLLLGYFKYFSFLIKSINSVWMALSGDEVFSSVNILLPVGISFFTFQAIGYCVDVYRGTAECEKNPLTLALFVSFFPQLVAGPIERSNNLLKQLKGTKNVHATYQNLVSGFIMTLYGLFLKMVIADRLAIVADNVFNSYYFYGSTELIVGSIAFSFQIYCDFASYSIIAAGSARMLGISLMENFRYPYFARSIKEFWQGWHISLTTWLRDYVYIPLGGNRLGEKKRNRNLLITFLVSGIWHGANWTFLVWGILHGTIQLLQEKIKKVRAKDNKNAENEDLFSANLGKRICTFVIVDILWIFFRAPSLESACQIIVRMVTRFDPWVLSNGTLFNLGLSRSEFAICLFGLVVLFIVDLVKYKTNKQLSDVLLEEKTWFCWVVIFLLLFSVLIWGKYGLSIDKKQFIYFQF